MSGYAVTQFTSGGIQNEVDQGDKERLASVELKQLIDPFQSPCGGGEFLADSPEKSS